MFFGRSAFFDDDDVFGRLRPDRAADDVLGRLLGAHGASPLSSPAAAAAAASAAAASAAAAAAAATEDARVVNDVFGRFFGARGPSSRPNPFAAVHRQLHQDSRAVNDVLGSLFGAQGAGSRPSPLAAARRRFSDAQAAAMHPDRAADDVFGMFFGGGAPGAFRRPGEPPRPRGATARPAEAAARPSQGPGARGALLPPTRPVPDGAVGTECAVCLEQLDVGQVCCRPACLHTFHGACLREWASHSQTCPVCKLDLNAPDRELRFRLEEIRSLTAPELRYLAAYLDMTVDRGVERDELELALIGNPRVRVVCCQDELTTLPVARLNQFLQSTRVKKTAQHVEKGDLVEALFASGRFVRETAPKSFGSARGHAGSASARSPQRSAPY